MKTRGFIEVSTLIFVLMLVGHLMRLMAGWPVVVGSVILPVWASIIAIMVLAGVTVWGLSLLFKHA
ncbi:MAG: hypothetical protein LV481_11610 [Methylacidiphilales bacterium]|nr:hypothetical protein [Candidatus Methylacidiphilales bacterium]